MELKPAISINDQLNLLRSRGMIIEDESLAKSFLESNHYYRMNIYFHKSMLKPNCYENKIKFSEIVSIYENDRLLRINLLSLLERIEIKTRTHISHYLAMTYGSDAFYKEEIFKENKNYLSLKKTFEYQVQRNKKDPVIVHHKNKYEGKFPIWVIIEYLTFNTLSKLFKNLLEKDKKIIANRIFGVNDYLFGQWLHVLSIQRNICAHFGYLYRRRYAIRPIIANSFHWEKNKDDYLFAQCLVLKRLSEEQVWISFIEKIMEYEETKTCFHLSDYGFPRTWKSYLL